MGREKDVKQPLIEINRILGKNMADEFTFDSVIDFFKERGIDWKCPCCEKDQWMAVGPAFGPRGVPVVTMKLESVFNKADIEKHYSIKFDGVSPEEVKRQFLNAKISLEPVELPILILICKNCGFIKMHSANFIRNKGVIDNGQE